MAGTRSFNTPRACLAIVQHSHVEALPLKVHHFFCTRLLLQEQLVKKQYFMNLT